MAYPQNLKKCDNPLCERRVSVSTKYCCVACGDAHEGGYEIHKAGPLAHSQGCNERDRERRPWAYKEVESGSLR